MRGSCAVVCLVWMYSTLSCLTILGTSTSLDVRRPQVASRSKVDSSQVSHYSKGKLKGKTGNKRSATKGHHPAGRSHRPVAGRQQPFARQQHPVARSQQSGFSTPLYSSDSDGEVMTGVWSASPPTMPTAARHIQPVSEDVQMRNQLSGEQSRPDQKDSSELNVRGPCYVRGIGFSFISGCIVCFSPCSWTLKERGSGDGRQSKLLKS